MSDEGIMRAGGRQYSHAARQNNRGRGLVVFGSLTLRNGET